MNILVLGATGLLGNAVFRVLSEAISQPVFGTIRNEAMRDFFIPKISNRLIMVENLEDETQIIKLFKSLSPKVVINCTSLSKNFFQDFHKMSSLFSVFPRRLAHLCRQHQIRLIQISSDAVFKGDRGNYTEDDLPDAKDLYGIVKFLGEVEGPGAITLRTSIIGHEICSKNSFLEWFLSQKEQCIGYTKAIYTGFPNIVLAQIIRDIILPQSKLEGIYHLASFPISKFDLLNLIAKKYGSSTTIIPDDKIALNRSLLAHQFAKSTGYQAPKWPELVNTMYSYKFGLKEN